MYAGVCETDISPPPGVRLFGAGSRTSSAVHDPLFARALVLDNGRTRIAVVTADLAFLPNSIAADIRAAIATKVGMRADCVLIACSGSGGAPATEGAEDGAPADAPYLDILSRKVTGAVMQAASVLEAVHLTYGEAAAQIGIAYEPTDKGEGVAPRPNYAGIVIPTVQALCISGADGKLAAMLFSHACEASAAPEGNLLITADWPGASVRHLKARFVKEGPESGVRDEALPLFLQGSCAGIVPARRGNWDDVRSNGQQIADAAHAARWNAHGRQAESLSAREIIISLSSSPDSPAPSAAISHIVAGSVNLFAFPFEISPYYQLDLARQSGGAIVCVSNANGHVLPVSKGRQRDSQNAAENFKGGDAAGSDDSEGTLRAALYSALQIESPDITPYGEMFARDRE